MIRSYDTEVAMIVGTNAAVVYQEILDIQEKSVPFCKVYARISIKELSNRIQFLSKRQVELAVDKLIKKGFIVTAECNDFKWDRTKSYSAVKI